MDGSRSAGSPPARPFGLTAQAARTEFPGAVERLARQWCAARATAPLREAAAPEAERAEGPSRYQVTGGTQAAGLLLPSEHGDQLRDEGDAGDVEHRRADESAIGGMDLEQARRGAQVRVREPPGQMPDDGGLAQPLLVSEVPGVGERELPGW
jgi:hypothetical protein